MPKNIVSHTLSYSFHAARRCLERGISEQNIFETVTLGRAIADDGDKAVFARGRTHSRQILDRKSSVRRLTPVECERLQGFPDEYTAIPWHRIVRDVPLTVLEKSYRKYLKRMKRQGKHPLSFGDVLSCADGPRYKALGNSMAVPVMRWLARRTERVLLNFRARCAEPQEAMVNA